MTVSVPAIPVVPLRIVGSVSAEQMAEVDRAAIHDYGVTILQMMEQAGSHLAEVARWEVGGHLGGRSIVVAVGPGNNGGGGLVAARHLANRGAQVRVVLSRPALQMSEPSRHHLATLIAMGAECCVATYDLDDVELATVLSAADLILDAILGYRVQDAPHGEEERLIERIAEVGRPILSLDLPSGLDPDTGLAAGQVVSAAATMTLALPKSGLIAGDGPTRSGRLFLADLGLPDALYTALGIDPGRPFAEGRIVQLDRSA